MEWCIVGMSKDLWLLINSLEMRRLVTGMSTLEEHLREVIVPALDESLCSFEKRVGAVISRMRIFYPSIERDGFARGLSRKIVRSAIDRPVLCRISQLLIPNFCKLCCERVCSLLEFYFIFSIFAIRL